MVSKIISKILTQPVLYYGFTGSFLESVKCPYRPGLKDVNIWTENGADLKKGNFMTHLFPADTVKEINQLI